MVDGFSIRAGVCLPARDRLRLERLLRYAVRLPASPMVNYLSFGLLKMKSFISSFESRLL
jgi:hypothetical protein